ncbi:MAG TPA: septal ring lytic transglycosylase RlpA family protein, partial [Ignavibacteriaceae bacterium]
NRNFLDVGTGTASFYADEFNGKKTANGEVYNMNDLTAAHPSYPFNTLVKVTNLSNNKSVEVRINDRMPDFKGRVIDLSYAAAKKIEMINAGIQEVKLEVIKWGN